MKTSENLTPNPNPNLYFLVVKSDSCDESLTASIYRSAWAQTYMLDVWCEPEVIPLPPWSIKVLVLTGATKHKAWTVSEQKRLTFDSWVFWRIMSCSSSPISNTLERWPLIKITPLLRSCCWFKWPNCAKNTLLIATKNPGQYNWNVCTIFISVCPWGRLSCWEQP